MPPHRPYVPEPTGMPRRDSTLVIADGKVKQVGELEAVLRRAKAARPDRSPYDNRLRLHLDRAPRVLDQHAAVFGPAFNAGVVGNVVSRRRRAGEDDLRLQHAPLRAGELLQELLHAQCAAAPQEALLFSRPTQSL